MKTTLFINLDDDVIRFLGHLGFVDPSEYLNQLVRQDMLRHPIREMDMSVEYEREFTDILQRHADQSILGAD